MKNLFLPVPDENLRPLIDGEQLYSSYLSAKADAKKYVARLGWQDAPNGKRYLVSVRTVSGIRQKKGMGVESPETQKIYTRYVTEQKNAQLKLIAIDAAYQKCVRMNRALRLGDTPPVVVHILKELEQAALTKKVLIIGTNAIFAYSSAARVTADPTITATRDLDLLWDSRSKIKIVSPDPEGLLGIIKKADSTFGKMTGQGYTIINSKGYQVDLIKRNEGFHKKEEPYQIWKNEDDFWAVKTNNMDWLLSAPRFSHSVMATNGEMSTMNTLDPRAFVLFKYWLSEQPSRDPAKARRDKLQAVAIQSLIEDWLPNLSFQELVPFPQTIRDAAIRNKTVKVDAPIELTIKPARPRG